jgi:hypothetical protein
MGSTDQRINGSTDQRIGCLVAAILVMNAGCAPDGDVRKAVHHCADDQIYPWKLQGILS